MSASPDVLFPNRRSAMLDDYDLDDVFSDLERDQQGRATMSVVGKSQRLDVVLGRSVGRPIMTGGPTE